MTAAETHQYCNAFSLIFIGRGTEDGDLIDFGGEKFHTIEELTDVIAGIPTLDGKPKLMLILRCVDGKHIYKILLNFFLYFSNTRE